MISPEQERALLDATALGLDDDLRAAYRRMMALIDSGMPPREAIRDVLATFRGRVAHLLTVAFSAILGRSVGTVSVLAMKVSGVSLSQRLYAQSRQVSALVAGIINRHAAGFQDARKLTLDLYEGYGFKVDEVLNLSRRNPKLPKYLRRELLTDPGLAGDLTRHFTRVRAARIKTPALKAGYLQYLDGLERGAGRAALDKKLDVAFHERMRYFANRIAQTELHRAYADRQAVELMDDEDVKYVQWRMSGTHPKTDICDYFARVDRYGLGPGVFPKALAPKAPAHPFCRCVCSPRLDISPGAKARERPQAGREWLKEQGINEGAAVMGSRAKLQAALQGADPVAVWNANADPMYRVGTVGATDPNGGPVMPAGGAGTDNKGVKTFKFTGQRPGLADLPPVTVTELTGMEFGIGLSHRDLVAAANSKLRTLQGGQGLPNDDTGWGLRINKNSRKKMGDNEGQSTAELRAIAGIEALARRAVVAESHPDLEHHNEFVKAVYRLFAPVLIDGQLHYAKLTVKDYRSTGAPKTLHALAAVEIENAPLGTLPTSSAEALVQSGQPTTGRTVNIADLLKNATKNDGEPFDL
ncbi:MAG: hypothetical protein Q8O34_16675 [Rhodocyclaceae bacterium]|nr:hypothetical protein [Rhodocyclaceae bacterium]